MLKISDLSYDWKLSDIDKVQKNKLKVFSFFAGALSFLGFFLITKPVHNSPVGGGGSNATKYLPVFTSFSPY
jgi:hypothetical protein